LRICEKKSEGFGKNSTSGFAFSLEHRLCKARPRFNILDYPGTATRKDKDLDGNINRLPMLTRVMFLRFLDDKELQREAEAKLAGKMFKPTIEPPFRGSVGRAGFTGFQGWGTGRMAVRSCHPVHLVHPVFCRFPQIRAHAQEQAWNVDDRMNRMDRIPKWKTKN
jgi:hypothetical protein